MNGVGRKSILAKLMFLASLCLVLSGCSYVVDDTQKNDPYNFYISYMELCSSKGLKEAQNYRYWESEEMRIACVEADVGGIQYEVQRFEKINNELYGFTVLFSSEAMEEGTARIIYNFVGVIDGKYKVIANKNIIPDEIRDGLIEDNYEYIDQNVLESSYDESRDVS